MTVFCIDAFSGGGVDKHSWKRNIYRSYKSKSTSDEEEKRERQYTTILQKEEKRECHLGFL